MPTARLSMSRPGHRARLGLIACAALAAGLVSSPAAAETAGPFAQVASAPAYLNAAPANQSVSEISTLTKDGSTLIYTDAANRQVGFFDMRDPSAPKPAGSIAVGGEPTSVYATNKYILVVVDTSTSFTNPSGQLIILSAKDRSWLATYELGGQPDSIDVTDNGKTAVIAIENQRDEDVTPAGGDEGDLPQAPAGYLAVVDLNGNVNKLVVETVSLTGLAGLDTPEDPEPEYVSISPDNKKVAVTLQENNAIAVVDIKSRTVITSYTAGLATIHGVDTVRDGVVNPTGTLTDVPREPDAIGWIGNDRLATANEGDWKGGSRGWTIFDAATGAILWDAGNSFENLAIEAGRYPENRADKKGTEPEGLLSATFGKTPYVFVASERANFVAVYDVTNPAAPVFVQLLPTLPGPEGLVADEKNGLLYVSSETDNPSGTRAGVMVFAFTG